MTRFDLQPITLTEKHVILAPLAPAHIDDLFSFGQEEELWRYGPVQPMRTRDDAVRWHDAAQAEVQAGRQLVFTIVHRADGRAIGSTRFGDIRRDSRGLEIGWTWVGAPYRRTIVNTECKYLLLCHAFDELGALRVQLKTDLRNERSQRAIERIGAVREGVLRRHMILHDGVIRDTVMYSVVDTEWPTVKGRLLALLGRTEP